jgi:hypothetical protein
MLYRLFGCRLFFLCGQDYRSVCFVEGAARKGTYGLYLASRIDSTLPLLHLTLLLRVRSPRFIDQGHCAGHVVTRGGHGGLLLGYVVWSCQPSS